MNSLSVALLIGETRIGEDLEFTMKIACDGAVDIDQLLRHIHVYYYYCSNNSFLLSINMTYELSAFHSV